MTISALTQVGYNSFPELNSKVVQVAMFVIRNEPCLGYKGVYLNLNSAPQSANKNEVFLNRTKEIEYVVPSDDFKRIPGSPLAYWVSEKVRGIFESEPSLGDLIEARQGLGTGEDDKFFRFFWEINKNTLGLNISSAEHGWENQKKWFPLNKGGIFRKWYGNREYVIAFDKKNRDALKEIGNHLPSERLYFKPSISWSDITTSTNSFRSFDKGFLFSNTGHCAFPKNPDQMYVLLSYCNNNFVNMMTKILNPTIHFPIGYFNLLPYPTRMEERIETIKKITEFFILITKNDWDTYENSWGFLSNPLIIGWSVNNVIQQNKASNDGLSEKLANPTYKLSNIYPDWQVKNCQTITEMQRLEQENNRLFIDAYGLQDELEPDVPLEQITLTINPKYRYGGNLSDEQLAQRFQSDTLAELISYALGCMMGRYRLDKPGLIYAHSGNIDFDKIYNAELVGWVSDSVTQQLEATDVGLRYANPTYTTNSFTPDDDGIIPLTDQEWFKDDATTRFRDFVRTVWGEENLQANLDFVAESLCLNALKPKKSESNLETVRRYLSTQFYKDHLKTYKKRPIYWLFSSGKQKGFECLVYLHRYNESTLSRMRTEYVTPLLGKYDSFAVQLNKQMEDASTTEVTRLKKDLVALEKKQTELRAFDDKLKHYADMRIKIDLDDGVKVNYGKFSDLLVDVKAITGGKE